MDFIIVRTVYRIEDGTWTEGRDLAINKNHILETFQESEGVLALVTARYSQKSDGTGENKVIYIRHVSFYDFVHELNGR